MSPLTIGVIGPCGFTGSHVCLELLQRGHKVIGISRHPEQLGQHPNYSCRSINIETIEIFSLVENISGLDVLISCYGPHTGGAGALQYGVLTLKYSLQLRQLANEVLAPFMEVARRLILAVKKAETPYFLFIGGAGSLHVPDTFGVCTVDHPDFFVAYRRAIADSHAHTSYMEERLGHMGVSLREFRNARLADREGRATKETRDFIETYEQKAKSNDHATAFIKAARTSFMFFDGNKSFPWTFLSPPPLYRSGKRTGKYEVEIDTVPLKGPQKTDNFFEGRLTGITASDMAVAIADEAESREHLHLHWTASGNLSDDTPAPSYVTLKSIL